MLLARLAAHRAQDELLHTGADPDLVAVHRVHRHHVHGADVGDLLAGRLLERLVALVEGHERSDSWAPSVVKLETRLGRATAEGSGIVLDPDGLILTNNHVVSVPGAGPDGLSGAETTATFNDGRIASFTIIGADPMSDIAVIRAKHMSGLTAITIGSSADLRVGQSVVAVGSPLGLESTVTAGIISALNRPVSTVGDADNQNTVLDAIQTDAAINPGNSGGALVNMNGELIGVNSAIATLGDSAGPDAKAGSIGLGFAIPVDQAKRIADQLIATGKASHASLGVRVTSD